ncbi:MAG TPA: hypothetical protein VHS53_15185, partial [Mucilaginibacter sp.]|nr:hypothetical protein [Mucilaginibacter sp.]
VVPGKFYVGVFGGGGGFISKCPINQVTGSFGACVNNSSSSFNGPKQVAINKSTTNAYITNTNTSIVSLCSIDGGGSFSSCVNSGGTGFASPWGIVLL